MAFPKAAKKQDEKPTKGAKVIPLAKAKVVGADKPKVEAAKKAVKPAPEPKAKKEKGTPGRKSKLQEQYGGKKITVNCPTNPKRGKSAERFSLYKTGMKTDEAVAAGVTWADIEYDQKDHAYKNKKGEPVTGPFITLK